MPLAGERVRASDISNFEIGFAEITANPTGTTSSTLADVAGLSFTGSVISGRLYQVMFTCRGVQSATSATDVVQLAILVNGTVIDDGFWITTGSTSARWKPNMWARYLATSTGSVTFKIQMARNSGSG